MRLLTGKEEADYIQTLLDILQAARLNNHFPDTRTLSSHIRGLSPGIHRGLFPGLEVDRRSGLPSYKSWVRVQTDVNIASEQLLQFGNREELERKASVRPDSVYGKQLRKYDYYRDLQGSSLALLGGIRVRLRRADPVEGCEHFNVVLDKLDSSGLFVRYTIDLAQSSQGRAEQALYLDGSTARHSDAFQAFLYKSTTLNAELTFIRLAAVEGLEVEKVVKGVVGPFVFPWMEGPEMLKKLLAAGGFMAMFSLNIAARDLAMDRDNDPIEATIAGQLSARGLNEYERARQGYGYRVFSDRKFVVPKEMAEPLRRFCTGKGTRNIIYSI